MTRPILDRLHRAGPWFCSTAILLFVALSPVIFVTASGDEWLLPWILAGVPVVALTLWLTAMAYDSGQAPVEASPPSAEASLTLVEMALAANSTDRSDVSACGGDASARWNACQVARIPGRGARVDILATCSGEV